MQWLKVIEGHRIFSKGGNQIQRTCESSFYRMVPSPAVTWPSASQDSGEWCLCTRLEMAKCPVGPEDSTVESRKSSWLSQITANDNETSPPKACRRPTFCVSVVRVLRKKRRNHQLPKGFTKRLAGPQLPGSVRLITTVQAFSSHPIVVLQTVNSGVNYL
jgi:hypothetical protein